MNLPEINQTLSNTRKELEGIMKAQYDLSIDIGHEKMNQVYEYANKIKLLKNEEVFPQPPEFVFVLLAL